MLYGSQGFPAEELVQETLKTSRYVKRWGLRMLLVVVSVFLSLALAEIGLRLFAPRFGQYANSQKVFSSSRLFVNRSSTSRKRMHPDRRDYHQVYINSLGLRHDRETLLEELNSGLTIGLFGDSQTENVALRSALTYPDVLDFLMREERPDTNVLNLGVSGYGTDQCYLAYLDSSKKVHYDHVFYVLWGNDLTDIYENNIFSLTNQDQLQLEEVQPSAFVGFVSRLYLTYCFVEVVAKLRRDPRWTVEAIQQKGEKLKVRSQSKVRRKEAQQRGLVLSRNDQRLAQNPSEFQDSIDLMLAILAHWEKAVEEQGGKFHIVLLPAAREQSFRDILPQEYDIIDLLPAVQENVPTYRYYDDACFKNDAHLSEFGNFLVAKHLYRAMEKDILGKQISEVIFRQRISAYYSAVDLGWEPPGEWTTETSISENEARKIRGRYREVDDLVSRQ
jgi:hypothetical protein